MNKVLNAIGTGFILSAISCFSSYAQQKEKDNLGDKEYIIVKDYKPVLAESFKISDSPEADTSSAALPAQNYRINPKQAETEFETATIKAVKIKDESLSKLYRNHVVLGLGNYSKYNGELYVNSLRSKKGSLGLSAKHLSASPNLKNVGDASYSQNDAEVYGKYFLENVVFSGEADYDRDVVHYYGFNTADTIIDKKSIRQRFSTFAFSAGLASNHSSKDRLNYNTRFGFSNTSDAYEVGENDFSFKGMLGKEMNGKYGSLAVEFNYFKKTPAENETLSLLSNLNRNIVRISPKINLNKDKVRFELGGKVVIEKNLDSDLHLYPDILVSIPIADNILSAFARVDGDVQKNSFRTLTLENPFMNPAVEAKNSNRALSLQGGLTGNFSNTISFSAWAKYSTYKDKALFVTDSVFFNQFDLIYDDVNILDLHAEIGYHTNNTEISFHVDQYSYSTDLQDKVWHMPANEMKLQARYVLRDKINLKAAVYHRGKSYARMIVPNGFISEKINSYIDANLGVEYRYSKILSVYLNMNNLGFSRYQRWYNYPSEKFNVLGGISYSF
ncbi:MAG: TonB-dependent receptor [Bacteroidetes bacterium]|nr:MAG: TonB-dependent receptor [Bacteroidota bacterium]REK05042.1 MAG: TonB-dependent receptor [Bacteroidota bacterium]REK36455.1 MAG: TonB-dependent receptor [Bacteroidota bacterium]REK51669.1 MAG: TonB-dependent receptor [Bacteroidota bacterium]